MDAIRSQNHSNNVNERNPFKRFKTTILHKEKLPKKIVNKFRNIFLSEIKYPSVGLLLIAQIL